MKNQLIKEVCKITAHELGIEADLILTPLKSRTIAAARHIVIYVLYSKGLNYSEIGRYLNKNHATAINACRKVTMTPDLYSIAERVKTKVSTQFPDFNKISIFNKNAEPYKLEVQPFFQKYEARCQICGDEDIVEIHHKIPRRSGGSSGIENLLILCPNHHRMIHLGLIRIEKIGPAKLLNPDENTKEPNNLTGHNK